MKFIDYAKIHVRSGDGGQGCVSFRREKFVPKGGPDGGDGGRGGHIIFRADPRLNTLLDLRYKKIYNAKRGGHGKGKKMHGKDGEDLVVRVPVGTILKDEQTGEIITDLDTEEKSETLARGGKGGLGNTHFKTSTNQAPRYAQPGLPGEEKELIVELKLLANVGLVGLPNAGKSTLISVISHARPKIADYPFTTLVPNLGVVKLEDYRSFVVADIPGLIEGAHKGAGLGFQFLRHVERTSILLHLVDVGETAKGDPAENLRKLNNELSLYNENLLQKPQAVAATKCDIKGEGKRLDRLSEYCKTKGVDFFPISAVTGTGVKELIAYLSRKVEE
jgi:GTP-binding protein